MGYTLELWAVPVETLVGELTRPSLGPEVAESDETIPRDITESWADLAASVAEAVRSGGGELGGRLTLYVQVVVRALGTHYGSLDHTSLGGGEFRRRFLPGPAANRLGRGFVGVLVNRPLAGLTWAGYPVIGWASVVELRAAAALDDDADDTPVAPQDVEPLHMLVRAVHHAARLGVDLVSVYG